MISALSMHQLILITESLLPDNIDCIAGNNRWLLVGKTCHVNGRFCCYCLIQQVKFVGLQNYLFAS